MTDDIQFVLDIILKNEFVKSERVILIIE